MEMKTANFWEDGCEAQFRAQGPKYRKIANLYHAYVQALGAASSYQDKARNLSIADLWLLATPSDWTGVAGHCASIRSFHSREEALGNG